MSNQTPNRDWDEQFADGLPLPDADKAWQDMSTLLDQEDRRRRPVAFPLLLSGCSGWALVLLAGMLLGGAGLWIWWSGYGKEQPHTVASQKVKHTSSLQEGSAPDVNPEKKNIKISRQTEHNTTTNPASHHNPLLPEATTVQAPPETNSPTGQAEMPAPAQAEATTMSGKQRDKKNRITLPGTKPRKAGTVSTPAATSPASLPVPGRLSSTPETMTARTTATDRTQPVVATPGEPNAPQQNDRATATRMRNNAAKLRQRSGSTATNRTAKASTGDSRSSAGAAADRGADTDLPQAEERLVARTWPVGLPGGFTLRPIPERLPQSLKHETPPESDSSKAPLAKKRSSSVQLSAGLSLFQGIPIAGQQSGGGNYQGRSGLISDHLPALWVRAEKGRWMLQGEVRPQAPQFLPQYWYSQKVIYDTAGHSTILERQRLRRAYYHQFPLTLSYRVWRGWSLGAGAQFNLLQNAVGERERVRTPLGGNAGTVMVHKEQIGGYRDSFLYRQNWSLLLHTEYQWKRWSAGLRYRRDLQPYLRYTRPEGTITDMRNEALDVFIRFRIWKSKSGRR